MKNMWTSELLILQNKFKKYLKKEIFKAFSWLDLVVFGAVAWLIRKIEREWPPHLKTWFFIF